MSIRIRVSLAAVLLLTAVTVSTGEKKNPLPATVLRACTVLVLVDPDASISLTDPAARRNRETTKEQAAALDAGRILAPS
jgi:hypothetical protein